MTKLFMVMLVALIMFTIGCGCEEKKSLTANIEKEVKSAPQHDYYYILDSILFAENNGRTNFHFNKDKAEIWLIKKWNTPEYYSKPEGIPTYNILDGGAFMGYDAGDGFVYFLSEYIFNSEYKKIIGDSTIIIEKCFPRDGVTRDVRQTCWWISSIKDYDLKNFDREALCSVTCINPNEFGPYMDYLKKLILECPGNTVKDKLLNFTKKIRTDNPSHWDAWKWPGYYE